MRGLGTLGVPQDAVHVSLKQLQDVQQCSIPYDQLTHSGGCTHSGLDAGQESWCVYSTRRTL